MYKLQSEENDIRTYRSEITGTEVEMFVLRRTPETGERWWAFKDLLNIPFIRKKAAESLTQLYGAGIIKNDLTKFTDTLKTILRGNDADKYEKAYSNVLQLEEIAEKTADPIKQSLALCSVYILSDNERPDTFSSQETAKKMEHWALQPDLQSFF